MKDKPIEIAILDKIRELQRMQDKSRRIGDYTLGVAQGIEESIRRVLDVICEYEHEEDEDLENMYHSYKDEHDVVDPELEKVLRDLGIGAEHE